MKRLQPILKALACICLLAVFLGCAALSKSPSPGPGADDALITSQVLTAFFHEPGLRSTQISVTTSHGVVKLTGIVEKSAQVEGAGNIAGSVPGVVQVKNELTVKE